MFDIDRLINVKVPSPAFPDGWKRATVRFPTDEEWCRRIRRQETIVQDLGRGASQTDTPNAEAVDDELFRSIRKDEGGAEFDAYEASRVISTIATVRPVPPERVGAGYRVALNVPGGAVVHRVKMPTAKQLAQYRDSAARATDQRHGIRSLKLSLEPAGELYDSLVESVDGYVGAVPIIHKSVVISEIRADLDALTSDLDPE